MSLVGIPSLFLTLPFIVLIHLAVPTDTVAFVLIIVRAQTTKSMYRGMKGPNILDTVSKDAWIYFAVISTYHCLTVIMYLAARVRFLILMFEFDAC